MVIPEEVGRGVGARSNVGDGDGSVVGAGLGGRDGEEDGAGMGLVVGAEVGSGVGVEVGSAVGNWVGPSVTWNTGEKDENSTEQNTRTWYLSLQSGSLTDHEYVFRTSFG